MDSWASGVTKGIFALMGTAYPESFDTLHSYGNAFEMPFVTLLAPESAYHAPHRELKHDYAILMRPGEQCVINLSTRSNMGNELE